MNPGPDPRDTNIKFVGKLQIKDLIIKILLYNEISIYPVSHFIIAANSLSAVVIAIYFSQIFSQIYHFLVIYIYGYTFFPQNINT